MPPGNLSPASDQRALERVCRHLRAALHADGVAVWREAPPAVVALAGLVPQPGAAGVESWPVVYAGEPVAQLAWSAPGDVSAQHGLVAAAVDIVAPLVASLELPAPTAPGEAPYGLVGVSDAIARVRQWIPRAAGAPLPALVEGESGVGKELVARALHAASPRRHAPFVAVNCAALSDELVDAELFGHVRGAFTGAALDRRGLIEAAHGGTLFLDEVAELSPRAQAKLLRTLQEGEVRRVGETGARTVDVRIVSATNRPLRDEVAAGRFRLDLRYRLEVLRIEVPPLRARPVDVPALVAHFWAHAMQRLRRSARLAASVLAVLAQHPWPGNARELQNAVAAIAAAGPARGLVTRDDLPEPWGELVALPSPRTLAEARRAFERAYVAQAFERLGARPSAVARELGVTRQGLAKLTSRLGIDARARHAGGGRER
ncbi:MAG: sigma 54-interacting transcriptional regulator [Vicinamibacterales bacterium]